MGALYVNNINTGVYVVLLKYLSRIFIFLDVLMSVSFIDESHFTETE